MTDHTSGAATSARYYSVRDVARILGVSTMTVYRAIDDGTLPAIRVRRRILVPSTALDQLNPGNDAVA